jgi:hypothetical protein
MSSRRGMGALVAAGLVLSTTGASGGAISAEEVMRRNEEARRVRDITSSATLTTTREGEDAKTKAFTWWRKLSDDGVHFHILTRFALPAEIRGEGILIDEHATENEILLYLPRFKKVRRVEGQSQSASFMGSVFSYSDIADPHARDYKHALLRSEPCPGSPGIACHVVESTPATDAVKERTGYARMVQWIRSDNFVTVRGELFDASGALWKRLAAADVREVDPREHRFLAHTVRIEDVRSKRATVLAFGEVKVNAGIPDATFTQQNLARE